MSLARPTEEEMELLKKLKSQVGEVLYSDELKSDHFLIRWIRARDHNLEKAALMLRSSIRWRKESEADKVLSLSLDPWLFKNFPFHCGGHDKLGNAFTELSLGAWDMRKAIDSDREGQLIEYITYFFEVVSRNIRKQNEGKKEGEWRSAMWTVVVDWEGYSYAQFLHWKAVQNILRMASTYESHYPEVLYKCFFINAPSIFPLLMGMFKSVLAPKTMKKIVVFGTDRKEWEPEVLKVVDRDQLAVKYGGNKIRE